jgi:hypothetical protein
VFTGEKTQVALVPSPHDVRLRVERALVGGEGALLPSFTEALRFEIHGLALVA